MRTFDNSLFYTPDGLPITSDVEAIQARAYGAGIEVLFAVGVSALTIALHLVGVL